MPRSAAPPRCRPSAGQVKGPRWSAGRTRELVHIAHPGLQFQRLHRLVSQQQVLQPQKQGKVLLVKAAAHVGSQQKPMHVRCPLQACAQPLEPPRHPRQRLGGASAVPQAIARQARPGASTPTAYAFRSAHDWRHWQPAPHPSLTAKDLADTMPLLSRAPSRSISRPRVSALMLQCQAGRVVRWVGTVGVWRGQGSRQGLEALRSSVGVLVSGV